MMMLLLLHPPQVSAMPCATRRGATRPTTRAHSAALHGRGDRICVRAQAGMLPCCPWLCAVPHCPR
eukprot:408804-Rhodomonas_salina.1